jgi:hypothetical protein
MQVITTRELTKLQTVPIENIIEKLDLGVPVCFVDPLKSTMKLFKVSKCEPCADAITLSSLRSSPRKILSKDIDITGARCVGYDVADDGGDRNCAIIFDGGIAINLDAWKAGEDELVKSAKRAWSHVENGKMLYDSIGVGAQVGSVLINQR